jgi:hypothetical protein
MSTVQRVFTSILTHKPPRKKVTQCRPKNIYPLNDSNRGKYRLFHFLNRRRPNGRWKIKRGVQLLYGNVPTYAREAIKAFKITFPVLAFLRSFKLPSFSNSLGFRVFVESLRHVNILFHTMIPICQTRLSNDGMLIWRCRVFSYLFWKFNVFESACFWPEKFQLNEVGPSKCVLN